MNLKFTSEEAIHHSKIFIIGTGSVAMACAVSILLKGLCGINEHYSFVFLVSWERMKSPELIKVKLTPEEEARLKKGAETLWKVQKELKL